MHSMDLWVSLICKPSMDLFLGELNLWPFHGFMGELNFPQVA